MGKRKKPGKRLTSDVVSKSATAAQIGGSAGLAQPLGEPDLACPSARGTVIRAGGGFYDVNLMEAHEAPSGTNALVPDGEIEQTTLESTSSPDTLVCTLRGTLKKGRRGFAQPVSVGDSVVVRVLEATGADARGRRNREGYITQVLPRRSALARSRSDKTAHVTMANLDQVVIVMALREPELNLHRLDRFLVLAEASELGAVICLNKIDLVKRRSRKAEIGPLRKLYEGLGYSVIAVSAETDENIDLLRNCLKDKISAVLGSSGVGKSSVINAVQPGLHLWVGDVMEIGKGRHTTSDVSLHPLVFGGYLADTPGIKTVSLFDRANLDLAQCFPEFLSLLTGCRFNNCRHMNEPGCAIHEASQTGLISASRYASYCKIQNESLDPSI